jgi:hypothetical protein
MFTLHIPVFTFIFQMFRQLRAFELHFALGMVALYHSMFTDLRMFLKKWSNKFDYIFYPVDPVQYSTAQPKYNTPQHLILIRQCTLYIMTYCLPALRQLPACFASTCSLFLLQFSQSMLVAVVKQCNKTSLCIRCIGWDVKSVTVGSSTVSDFFI